MQGSAVSVAGVWGVEVIRRPRDRQVTCTEDRPDPYSV